MRTFSFLSTLLLAGSAMALPLDSNTCQDRSTKTGEWTIKDFDFHAAYVFRNPAWQQSWGYVNFTLHNSALDYEPICSAQSNQLQDFFYGTVDYSCNVPVEGDAASFNFARPSNTLEVNQTWNCPDGPHYEAYGAIKLDLDCPEEKWENPDWHEGETYSLRKITCKKQTVKLPFEEISAGL